MLIGLTGLKGSGKNTVADYLTDKYDFEQKSFAAKVKESSAACFGIDPSKWEEWKSDPEMVVSISGMFNDEPDVLITVREFLQNYGVEAHRDIFGDSFWLDQVLPNFALTKEVWKKRTVVTDVRFLNEVSRVKENGGFIVNIERQSTETDGHSSEQPMPQEIIDHTIQNNSSYDDLYKSIDEFLIARLLLNATR